MTANVYLGLGSNLGNRQKNIERAVEELSLSGMIPEKLSSIIETDPVGGPPQEKYFNAVLAGKTHLSPIQLLHTAQKVEALLGRIRTVPNAPRTIDIDILLYNNKAIETPELRVPHPRMTERDFVMVPLAEIAPDIAKELQREDPS